MTIIHREIDPNHLDNVHIENPQPLTDVIMSDVVPANFKPPSLDICDGKKDPQEHLTTFDAKMAIVGARETLN